MGRYVNNSLGVDENVLHEAKLHWVIFFSPKALMTLFIGPVMQKITSEFAITDKRVIIKVGLISRKTIEIILANVESVNVDQTVMGRILGYGTIIVIGTGGTRENFDSISSPIEFRKKFQEVSMS